MRIIHTDLRLNLTGCKIPTVEKRTISLPHEQAVYIDSMVASGGYASASEVIRAGIRALQERDAVVNNWLIAEVVPVYDAMLADPGRGKSAEQVAERLRAHHAQRLENT